MRVLTVADLEAERDEFDRCVFATPGIDTFCSCSVWILPAFTGLMPARRPWLRSLGDGSGYVALALGPAPDGRRTLQPLEAVWGLASPLVGSDPENIAAACVEDCLSSADDWDALLVTGIPEGSSQAGVLVGGFMRARDYDAYLGPVTRRHVASLVDGLDGFLSRRTRNFRRSVLRARDRVLSSGFSFVDIRVEDEPNIEALFARLIAIEQRSWKGREGIGIEQGPMHSFYSRMLPRLRDKGWARLLVAQRDGRDEGFVLGAVAGGVYRGLQFSFDAAWRPLGLGNAMQLQVIERLAREGVGEYDLGSHADYKQRWAESGLQTYSIVIRRR